MSRYLLLLTLTVLLGAAQMGCSSQVPSPSVADPNISYAPYSHEAVNYFSELAFGTEFGQSQNSNFIVKWSRGMRVYISNANPQDLAEVERIIDELIQLTGLSIDFTNQPLTGNTFPENTIHISYTTQDEFNRKCGGNRYQDVVQEHREQKGFFCNDWNTQYVITKANILIDDTLQSQEQRNHLLREELTQALGIMKDSNAYTDSVFQASYSYAPTEYSELDKQVIQILYDRRLSPGMTQEQVLQALQN